jgi:hypothetical protein
MRYELSDFATHGRVDALTRRSDPPRAERAAPRRRRRQSAVTHHRDSQLPVAGGLRAFGAKPPYGLRAHDVVSEFSSPPPR